MQVFSARLGFEVEAELTDDRIAAILDALDRYSPAISYGPGSLSIRISVEDQSINHAFTPAYATCIDALTVSGLRRDIDFRLAVVEIATEAELEREISEPPIELVGATELAEMLGVTRQRASTLATSSTFPAPLARLASGPVWLKGSVLRFASEWERRPGRPRKKEAV
ncbi:MAG: hypothetical protein WD556_11460 [Actinomycetota bacterium]